MSFNVAALRRSFDLVVERAPNPSHRFYEILFERYPQARPLFRGGDQRVQEEMLTRALVAVIDHIDDAPWLTETLGALGRKHVDYGVTSEMYAWVGDALLATLEEVAGPDWTSEVAIAWREAYSAISTLMFSGAVEHRHM